MKKFKVTFKDGREDATVKADFVVVTDGILTFWGRLVGEISVKGPFRGIALSEIAEWVQTD